MMNRTIPASTLCLSLLLGACAGNPKVPPALAEARSTLHTAELDTAVLNYAPLELNKATESLQHANQLQAQGEPLTEINSAAYVANQQAKVAMAVAQAKSNDAAIAGAEADRERTRADVRAAEAQNAQAQASRAQTQANAAQAQAGAARAQNEQLRQQLADLQTQQTERGLLVTLGDVLFEFGRADIKPGAQVALYKLADFLQKNATRRILIEGHTDSVGSSASNITLSQNRAHAVAAALEGLGVSAQRVTSVGYGEDYPIAANTTDTNRALNRRVEVYITENGQPVKTRR